MNLKNIQIVSFNNPYPPNYGGVIDVFYKIKYLHRLDIEIYLHIFYDDRIDIDLSMSNTIITKAGIEPMLTSSKKVANIPAINNIKIFIFCFFSKSIFRS